MKNAKDFFEQLAANETFAREVGEAIEAKRKAGASNYYETIIPVAAERGYEISKEELDKINEEQKAELSEEELGKVAGGMSCLAIVSVLTVLVVSATATVSVYEITVNAPDK